MLIVKKIAIYKKDVSPDLLVAPMQCLSTVKYFFVCPFVYKFIVNLFQDETI